MTKFKNKNFSDIKVEFLSAFEHEIEDSFNVTNTEVGGDINSMRAKIGNMNIANTKVIGSLDVIEAKIRKDLNICNTKIGDNFEASEVEIGRDLNISGIAIFGALDAVASKIRGNMNVTGTIEEDLILSSSSIAMDLNISGLKIGKNLNIMNATISGIIIFPENFDKNKIKLHSTEPTTVNGNQYIKGKEQDLIDDCQNTVKGFKIAVNQWSRNYEKNENNGVIVPQEVKRLIGNFIATYMEK